MLTQRELAASRILAGSQYRLPTEAEWECAARAGTTTGFSYGDDPSYFSETNYAWFLDLAILDLTVHPVGQKLPNPWGLYDMAGNVWEWCQELVRRPAGWSSDRSDRPSLQSERAESHARWRLRLPQLVLPLGLAAFPCFDLARFRRRLPSGARHRTVMYLTFLQAMNKTIPYL